MKLPLAGFPGESMTAKMEATVHPAKYAYGTKQIRLTVTVPISAIGENLGDAIDHFEELAEAIFGGNDELLVKRIKANAVIIVRSGLMELDTEDSYNSEKIGLLAGAEQLKAALGL